MNKTIVTMKRINLSVLMLLAAVCGMTVLVSCTSNDDPVNNNAIRSIADLKGKTVGVEIGSIYDEELSKQNDFNVRRYADTKKGFEALVNGEIDAWKDDEIAISRSEMKRSGIEIGFLDDKSFDIGFAFRKDSQPLVDQFNAFLAEARQSGLYQEIYNRWINADDPENVEMPEIQQIGTGEILPVGINTIIAPMAFYIGTEWRGFEVELIRRFASVTNRPASIRLYTMAEIPTALQSGEIDLWSGELFITPERQEKYLFSDPYFTCHPAWFVRSAK